MEQKTTGMIWQRVATDTGLKNMINRDSEEQLYMQNARKQQKTRSRTGVGGVRSTVHSHQKQTEHMTPPHGAESSCWVKRTKDSKSHCTAPIRQQSRRIFLGLSGLSGGGEMWDGECGLPFLDLGMEWQGKVKSGKEKRPANLMRVDTFSCVNAF